VALIINLFSFVHVSTLELSLQWTFLFLHNYSSCTQLY